MAIGLVILAAIPAYLVAGAALLMGAGWMMAFAILVGMGMAGTLGLAALRMMASTETNSTPSLSLT